MRLYFVRHGQSTANTEHIIWSRDEGHPLTDEGRGQAALLAKTLRPAAVKHVYCSPIERAVETGQILAAALGAGLIVRSGLREINMGEIEGQSADEAWQKHNELYRTWWTGEDLTARIPGGESYLEARQRFVNEVNFISNGNGADENLLIVSHGGLLASMLPALLTNLPDDYGYHHLLGNTDHVLVEKRNDGLYCLKWQGVNFPIEE
jgi:probable phosphoglycerate mutase